MTSYSLVGTYYERRVACAVRKQISAEYWNLFTSIHGVTLQKAVRSVTEGGCGVFRLYMDKTVGEGESGYTGYTQKNGAVSKVNNKFISRLTLAQRTPSAAATVQVSHALPAVRFSCLLQGRGASLQDGEAAGKRFRKDAPCMVRLFKTVHCTARCTVIADLDTSKRSTQKAFSCCDAILETGPTVSTSE